MASPQQIRAILDVFEHYKLTGYDLLHSLLLTDMFKDHQVTKSFSDHVELCLEAFRYSTLTADTTSKWVFQVARQGYISQIQVLTRKENGFHFYAKKTTEEKLKQFSVDKVSKKMAELVPDLWNLLEGVLAADPNSMQRRAKQMPNEKSGPSLRSTGVRDGDIEMQDVTIHDVEMQEPEDSDNRSSGWIDRDVDAETQVPLVGDDEDVPEDLLDQLNHQESALATIVSAKRKIDDRFLMMILEASSLSKHHDAQYKPALQCLSECHWSILACC